jgi:aldehyde dehydrogenase (NAD+)
MPTISIKNSEQNRTRETAAYAPTRYTELDQQYIGGIWRRGKEGSRLIDTDPFTGKTLAEIVQANKADLDEAYQLAAKAQRSWAATNPAERAAITLRFTRIMEQRRDEIIDWLIKESGSTRLKAEQEWQWVYSITVEAASFPHRLDGKILPLDEYGKESRSYKQPLGVIGVISPWNAPMHLSQRSVAPALALGKQNPRR